MSPLEHVDDYPEIPVSLASTSTALKTGAWRSVRPILSDRTAPCTAGCPAGIGIPSYLQLIEGGDLGHAFAAVTDRNPFPRITGRVCPHRCEDSCNLAVRTGDAPISIRALERWLGDATAHLPHLADADRTGKRIAVVGSGPAGLAAAYYLRRSGHDVTVFERRGRPGGVLRYGIPDYRLPSEIVDDEIERLETMGIEFRTGVALGTDVTLDDLEASYAAVFVATGVWKQRPMTIEGSELLEPGLAFLDAMNHGDAMVPGPSCAVIGAGNTAMDVARVLRKLGTEVTVLYRRSAAEMPAITEEYRQAMAEGVEFEWLSQPVSIEKTDHGLIVTVEQMRLGDPDGSGRPRPEPTGDRRDLCFDGVYTAVGETADLSPFPARLIGRDGWIATDDRGATSDPLVFAGGDLATGPATVIEAIVAGRRAARAIDTQLGFADRWPDDALHATVAADEVNPAYAVRHPRPEDHLLHPDDPFAEETGTLCATEVLEEIGRCLSCGHCNECRTCFVFCPDGAITWDDGPVIDLEFCKGCGICVSECPGHALILVNERELTHA
jgi:NADPH-dependent glutamate synthase beta subunit-like oxidoreductase/NAD-dependent dihydropyrimidine dehydrogenase PreA subunit